MNDEKETVVIKKNVKKVVKVPSNILKTSTIEQHMQDNIKNTTHNKHIWSNILYGVMSIVVIILVILLLKFCDFDKYNPLNETTTTGTVKTYLRTTKSKQSVKYETTTKIKTAATHTVFVP